MEDCGLYKYVYDYEPCCFVLSGNVDAIFVPHEQGRLKSLWLSGFNMQRFHDMARTVTVK